MNNESPPTRWQEIGWDGLFFHIPFSWQPTVIYPAYMYFENKGRPAFEIKWQQVGGGFSPNKILDQLRLAQKNASSLDAWDVPRELQLRLEGLSVSGFRLQHGEKPSHGLVIHCPACGRTTLMQFHFDMEREMNLPARITGTFRDHPESSEQIWSVYDISAVLPDAAKLLTHEFLPGRYTLCFDLGGTRLTLYRFKPAAVLLGTNNIAEFGSQLVNRDPVEILEGSALWDHTAKGLELMLATARRKPVHQWMRLRHDPGHNVILGVRAEGKRWNGTGWLEKICNNFTSLDTL